jgi:Ca2+-binding RTX toxin-like protein
MNYQWLADGSAIQSATGNALTLTQAQVGKAISVKVSYTDLQGTAESVTSAITASVANVNDAPTGSVNIRGIPIPGKVLTAVNTLADVDGMGMVSYQWLLDGVNISGATTSALTLTQAQVGKAISVKASYTDGGGWFESVSSNNLYVAKNYTNSAPENTKGIVATFTVSDPNQFLIDPRSHKPLYPFKPILIGADAKFFKLVPQGSDANGLKFGLSLGTALDFEQPVDTNRDGIYEVSLATKNTNGYQVLKELTIGVEFAPILGTARNDVIKGTTGSDTLDGLAGNDTLSGGPGLDTFLVSSGRDTIGDFNALTIGATGSEILQTSAGAVADVRIAVDWIATADSFNDGTANLTLNNANVDLSAITHGLGWNVTNMSRNAKTIKGSPFDDVLAAGKGDVNLLGGAGNDLLYFGMGKDTLTGGLGADTFRMSGKYVRPGYVNHISDFLSGTDHIEIDHYLFNALGTGQLGANQFVQGTAATRAPNCVVYDQSTGNLWYDPYGGAGKVKTTLIAVLDNHAALTYSDLTVI